MFRSRLCCAIQSTSPELNYENGLLHSVVGLRTRHDRWVTRLRGSGQVSVPLKSRLFDPNSLRVSATLDGQTIEVKLEDQSLKVPVPASANEDSGQHRLILDVWCDAEMESTNMLIQPILKLPVDIGSTVWVFDSPGDWHVVWSSSTLGSLMRWSVDRMRLNRQLIIDPNKAVNDFGIVLQTPARSNRYAYQVSDVGAMELRIASRAGLWVLIAGVVMLGTAVMTYLPSVRRGSVAILGTVLIGGLLIVSPDLAVMAGQISLLAMIGIAMILGCTSLLLKDPAATTEWSQRNQAAARWGRRNRRIKANVSHPGESPSSGTQPAITMTDHGPWSSGSAGGSSVRLPNDYSDSPASIPTSGSDSRSHQGSTRDVRIASKGDIFETQSSNPRPVAARQSDHVSDSDSELSSSSLNQSNQSSES